MFINQIISELKFYDIQLIEILVKKEQSIIAKVNYLNKICIAKIFYMNSFNKINYSYDLELNLYNNLKKNYIPKLIEKLDINKYKIIIITCLENYVNLYDVSEKISNKEISYIFNKLLNIIEDFHKNAIHKDLKNDNIMYEPISKDINIIDFGLSFLLDKTDNKYLSYTSMAFDWQCPDFTLRNYKNSDIMNSTNLKIKKNIDQAKKNDLFSIIIIILHIKKKKHNLFKIRGILPEYIFALENYVEDNNYYKILKQYLNENINLLKNNSEIEININCLIKFYIDNIDKSYEFILDNFKKFKII